MFDPSLFANPTPLAHADASRDVLPRGGTSQWHTIRFNLYDPEMRNARRFNVWSEVYFSGSENVTKFLVGIDNQIKLLEIPSNLSCAYLKGHLLVRALDWYQIFESALVQNTATDFAQLKAALSKAFPAIQNRKDLETRFYASQQRQNQEPTDFVYELLKLQKKLELGMSEKALVDHIFVRLEPQVQDYVEVRNPQNAIQLLEVLAKFEERYSCKATRDSRNKDNVEGRGWNGVGCLILVTIEEIGEILKGCVDRIMIEMIIGVIIRIAVKEISGSRLPVLADLEYPCILGIYFIDGSKIILDFDRNSLAISDSQINKVVKTVEVEKVEIDLSKTKLKEKQKRELQYLFDSFQGLFSDKPGLTHVLYHEIDTGDNPLVVSRPYKYDRIKQEILDYHVDKMLKEGTIIPIQSPYASPVVLCRKNNGLPPDNPEACRFSVDYRKLNAITKYLTYPLPLIDNLIMNVSYTGIMSALDLRSGYFQMAVNPSDIVKTAFVTKNGTYAFRRMPFGLSGAAPNFQKAIDIILKPVIGKFVNVYMDDVIISSPSFTQLVKHLKEVFRLLHEAGLTLNKDKCKFGCEELQYLGLIINKEGIKTNETKIQAIVEMKPPRNSKEVSKFLGMSQWYAKFIKNYADICEPLYNLKRKLKKFIWTIEAQKEFDVVKAAITKAPVLKFPDFKKPFELFTEASSLGLGAVLNQKQRPVVFASRTLSAAERNYTVTEMECLAVVWALNKFGTYLGSLPIKVITDHAALTHLTNGKNLSNRTIRWALK
ncbi:retrovirus-related Pol polyprotein from transposon 297 [Trichonephila clavipes]|nr:retrovirus-related Pol polyprotein from transposon 297 [Trichonephila clavipes]